MQASQILSLWAGECVLCAAATHTHATCDDCTRELARFAHACPRCARAMPFAAQVCGRCLRKPPAFDAAVAARAYTYPTDLLVAAAKYNGNLAVARTFGGLLSEAILLKSEPQVLRAIDVILPIPLSPQRQAERGYNQATEIARVVAKALNRPLAADLMRTRDTQKQADLSLKARLTNVRGAFSAASLERPLAGKHVLLIDDVMTTGATLNEAAKALKEAGAAWVMVGVVARAVARTNL
jgi:ComF family protein